MKPILFSAPMVRAILDGKKTQTRRIVKPRHVEWSIGATIADFDSIGRIVDGGECAKAYAKDANLCLGYAHCPYGVPGDRLWVRETWSKVPFTAYRQSNAEYPLDHRVSPDGEYWAVYREGWERSAPSWKPSIHMPRWASRITLEIVSVKVERLQDISEADVRAEGLPIPGRLGYIGINARNHKAAFRVLWEEINGKGSWDLNPWLWVIEFRSNVL